MSFRLGYMTGEYPRATDTFIQREVAVLRSLSHHIETFSIRKTKNDEIISQATATERANTFYVLPPAPLLLFKSHVALLFGSPRNYFRGMRLALRLRAPGLRALARQCAYFVEAGIVARQMKQRDLHHLHNHFSDSSCSVAAIAAAMGGFTFSFTMHGPGEFFDAMRWRIDEKIRRALFVNCISYFCRSQAMIFAPVQAWPKLHVVHCGVDTTVYERRTQDGTGSRLLFVGRLAAVKGLPILLQALIQIPQATLTVAGDGPERSLLEKLAAEAGLADRVKFLGYQSSDQIHELLRQTDLFVLASFAEGVPVVLMEAMAAGVPVVATRIAGIAELVDEGKSGFLVPPGDSASLAAAIEQLLADGEMRQRFGQFGREKVEREFNLQREGRRLSKIFASAFEGKIESIRPSDS